MTDLELSETIYFGQLVMTNNWNTNILIKIVNRREHKVNTNILIKLVTEESIKLYEGPRE